MVDFPCDGFILSLTRPRRHLFAKGAILLANHTSGKALFVLLGVLMGLVLVILFGSAFLFRQLYTTMDIQAQETRPSAETAPLPSSGNVYNLLLLGNDSRSNDTDERTDVMLLVSVNRDAETITLVSFLRDIYLPIPGYYAHRLNTANVLGGPALTVETIENNFRIDIHGYAAVNFSAFVTIVDTLGGVELSLSADEARVVDCGESDGDYHLTGEQALSYCRIRSLDSDFGRTERQRKLLNALWEDVKVTSLPDAYSLMAELLPQITTDLSAADCLSLLTTAAQMGDYDLHSAQIPADGTWSDATVDGMAVLELDFETNIDHLRELLYGE